ncbi:MAG: aspartyl protease family protein [Treponematales bacterium]
MTVWEDLVLRNAGDLELVALGVKKESEVRQMKARFKVDTGAHRNVITRDVFEQLGLRKEGEQRFKMAGGQSAVLDVSSQMEINWHGRKITLDAAIAPEGANNLLSITAMELLDIMPDPSKGCLVGIHGDEYINELE